MNFIETKIPDLFIIKPSVFLDDRGYFLESFNKKRFENKILNTQFIQDNESKSFKGVLRGLHFQLPPFEQSKLVRCIHGEVLDVAVDLRIGSITFGKHFSIKLSGINKKQLFIPKGFAHGYVVLSETAIFEYKVDNKYAPDYESGILWNDPFLNIDWDFKDDEVFLTEKDKNLPVFTKLNSPFNY
ncbi:MAG: dTDP-4-dehydrorhamnose 3,5-epimerase [Candidatus Marinimicrobia bacterium]|nr:dTDP-4-dehydrorhamnose 3,5-epimerase [Candidatus Neomarinimicrobiota bacterium]